MPRNHARTRASELRLHLYERSVHPELFTALRRAELVERAYRASLLITGQSHVIAVRAGGETITEVLAPADAPLPRGGLRSSVQLERHTRDEVTRVEGALHYRGVFRVDVLAPAEFRDAATHLLARDGAARLKVFFDDDRRPPSDGGAELVPFALIDFRPRPRRLEVLSVHAWPHDLALVRVETRIDLAPVPT